MRLVARTGSQSDASLEISPGEANSLALWYSHAGGSSDHEVSVRLVRRARRMKAWIACDCVGGKPPAPLMTPSYLAVADTYYLRRLDGPKRARHDPGCPFFKAQAFGTSDAPVNPPEAALRPAQGYFLVLKPAPETMAQKPLEVTEPSTSGPTVPRLAKLTWALMEKGGLTTITPDGLVHGASIKLEFTALRSAATVFEVAPGMPLSEVFFTHPSALSDRSVEARLETLKPKWKAGYQPQGFLALYGVSLEGRTVNFPSEPPIEMAVGIDRPTWRGASVSGPYLMMVVVGEHPDFGTVGPVRAWAQPILRGNHFLPVDSDPERNLAAWLLKVQWLLARRGTSATIQKPMFHLQAPKGPIRPDFVLQLARAGQVEPTPIIVELLESDEGDYLEAKGRAHAKMQGFAPVFTLTMSQLESRRSLAAMIRLCQRVLRI